MDSDKSDEDEHEAISKQIVDYYRKYSQSKQLPKYFSGTSLSYMPQIVKDEEIVKKPLIVIEDTNSATQATKPAQQFPTDCEEGVEQKAISPASSVTSNRKLEWDNGADIGYDNCSKSTMLHKSVSLPVLLGAGDYKFGDDKPIKSKLSSQVVTIISYSTPSDDNSVDKQVQSSSSSSSYPPEAPPVQSTSSSGKVSTKPVNSSSSSSFATTLAYLKSKIGSPDAESTPKLDCKTDFNYNETPCAPKNKIREVKNRVIDLCITKPILIECNDRKVKKSLDKRIQTSFIGGLSKCVQTGDSLEDKVENQKLPNPLQKPVDNQSVIVINYDSESDKRTCSSNTQTNSDIIMSQCDSFEYYNKHSNNNINGGSDNLKRSKAKSDLAISTDSSKEIPLLGQLISKKQSKSLVGDVDKSIEILQKLLKSKKYDSTTKKRYIKKIVEKIVDNKYNEDSTTSSELFLPKKQDSVKIQQKLQENIPWYPPKMSKFTVKTFSDEFLPNGDQSCSRKKSVFTITQSQDTPSSCLESHASLEKQQNSSSGSYQCWKEDKTLSERLLEDKQKGQGDHLVKFAMKERQHQIAWINDEISHLTKLKGLLEKHQVQRTTTVYMLSEQLNKQSGSSGSGNSQKNSGRNYVIQTELSPSSSSDIMDFNLYDEEGRRNYHVKEVVGKTEKDKNDRKLVGDIEVVSDEKTTNIKVKTRKLDNENGKMFKPKEPILIGTGKYDTFPRSRAEEERCWPCGMMKSRKDRLIGSSGSQQYSFDVPLAENASSLIKKVDEIVSKYASKRSSRMSRCHCIESECICCKCGETKRSSETLKEVCNKDVQCLLGCNCQNNAGEIQTKEPSIPKATTDSSPKKCTQYVTCCECKNKNNELQAECVQTEVCICYDKHVQANNNADNKIDGSVGSHSTRTTSQSSSTSDSASETPTTSSESVQSCLCCKRKNVTAKTLYALRKKLSDKAYPLCRPCYRQNQRGAYSPNMYSNPGHVCNCYTVVETKTLDQIKKTISDLNDLDEQFCSCVNASDRDSSGYCRYCNCKLKKTSKNKNGIAYMLTFENESLSDEKKKKKKKKKQPRLEEIKIKIPVARKKKHKDKENKRKKESHSHSEENSTTSGAPKNTYNLQEYLKQNRPDFVEVAENRRKSVVDAKVQREELSDFNKLLFLQNYLEGNSDKNSKRLFSSKEMKEITRRNYQKLPEVQQKLMDNRERQIRQANRLMADTFNKKLRENVLKGKRTLPTDVNVVNYN